MVGVSRPANSTRHVKQHAESSSEEILSATKMMPRSSVNSSRNGLTCALPSSWRSFRLSRVARRGSAAPELALMNLSEGQILFCRLRKASSL